MSGRQVSRTSPAGWLRCSARCERPAQDLDFVLARRAGETPGAGVVFLTPLRGDAEINAAATLGFNVTRSVHAVRVEGKNEPGVAANITERLSRGRHQSAWILSGRHRLKVHRLRRTGHRRGRRTGDEHFAECYSANAMTSTRCRPVLAELCVWVTRMYLTVRGGKRQV